MLHNTNLICSGLIEDGRGTRCHILWSLTKSDSCRVWSWTKWPLFLQLMQSMQGSYLCKNSNLLISYQSPERTNFSPLVVNSLGDLGQLWLRRALCSSTTDRTFAPLSLPTQSAVNTWALSRATSSHAVRCLQLAASSSFTKRVDFSSLTPVLI